MAWALHICFSAASGTAASQRLHPQVGCLGHQSGSVSSNLVAQRQRSATTLRCHQSIFPQPTCSGTTALACSGCGWYGWLTSSPDGYYYPQPGRHGLITLVLYLMPRVSSALSVFPLASLRILSSAALSQTAPPMLGASLGGVGSRYSGVFLWQVPGCCILVKNGMGTHSTWI